MSFHCASTCRARPNPSWWETILVLGSVAVIGGCADRVPQSTQPAIEGVEAPLAIRAIDESTQRIEGAIAEREYLATPSRAGLQAPNRRQDFRVYFDRSGIRLHDRTAAGSPELVRLSLVRMGRESGSGSNALFAVGSGQLTSDGARVEIARPGLVEWYSNSARGLEQGFTIESRPSGEGELALELEIGQASASLRGDQILLATESGRRLSYDKLIVVDAAGAVVASRMEVPDPGRIRIVVDDRAAEYPITIDPLLTGTANGQLRSDQESAELGASVASAGDVDGDGFDDVIIGAPRFDAGEVDEGAVFLFRGGPLGIPNGTPENAATILESNAPNGRFGESVDGAGDVDGDGYDDVIVGAPYFPNSLLNWTRGRVFVFQGGPYGIAGGDLADASAVLEASPEIFDEFGYAVAGAGDVNADGYDDVIVGAPSDRAHSGAAYVFLGSAEGVGSGEPQQEASAIFTSFYPEAGMGSEVSAAGDVNGDGYDDVVVVSRTGTEGEDGSPLGTMVYHGGPTGPTSGIQTDADTVLLLWGDDVDAAGDVNGDGFDDLIVGSTAYFGITSGAAFVFHGGPAGIPSGNYTTAATQLDFDQGQARSPVRVAGAGDVNGDGFDDVLVGAPLFDAGQDDEGAAFLFLGHAAGIPDGDATTAFRRLESNQTLARFGSSVAGAGDFDQSGTGDVIVGAEAYDAGETDEGAAFIYLPEPSGLVVSLTSGVTAFGLAARLRRRLESKD